MENLLVRFPMNAQRLSSSERKDGRTCISLQGSSSSHRSITNRSQARSRQSKKYHKGRYDLDSNYDASYSHKNLTKGSDKNHSGTHLDGYIHASFQFKMLPGCTYLQNTCDETSPQWDEVALIRVLNKGDLACPICLYSPVTPRMGKCGHVYCWPCAMQYIKYENNSTDKKCAVCSCLLSFDDLKRVSLVPITQIKHGDILSLALVKRLGPYVVRCLSSQKGENTPESTFQCVCIADLTSMRKFIETDINDLSTHRAICEIDWSNTELIPFIDLLLNKLRHEMSTKFSSNNEAKFAECSIRYDHPHSTNQLYFYQAADGQPIFLDGLAWRCLLTEYKNIENLPEEIAATVVSVKNCRMDPVLRKRLRYLNYLPDGYAFSLVEIELKPPLVSELTLSRYATVLNNRAIERNRSHLEDLKLTELKEAAENQFMSLPPGFVLSGHAALSDKQEVQLDPSDFVPLSSLSENLKPKSTLPISFAEIYEVETQRSNLTSTNNFHLVKLRAFLVISIV
ncbi:unnamed protein product [Heterobilharzia americana]|nr:unnamed protein product [Heterobilharzia americana]CAH8574034.1 unnamed protein product [Heterobilharzia americana]